MQDAPVTVFAQKLAANSRPIRDKAIRRLKKWIGSRQSTTASEFAGNNMLKLWKGLFYCMWMSDKPEVQEELARTISELIHVFGSTDSSLQFIKGFFETMNREWSNLDYLRIDKYMMFVRVFLNQSLEFVRRLKWHGETTNQLIGILENVVINPKAEDASMGLRIHMADIYVEELAKVAGNELTGPQLTLFFLPYCRLLAENKNAALRWSVIHHVFEFTMRLCDDNEGDESGDEGENQFEEPTSPSKEREAVPDGDNHEEEDEDMESDEDDHLHKLYGEYKGEDKFLRKVRRHEMESMKLPFPNFDYQHIGDTLLELVGTSVVPIKQKLRNQTYNLVKRFHEMACGVFPLDGVNPSIGRRLRGRDYDAAALRLLQLDEEISKEKRSWRESDDRKRKQAKTDVKSEETGSGGEPSSSDKAGSSDEEAQEAETSLGEDSKASPKLRTNGNLHLGKSVTGTEVSSGNQTAKKNRKRRRLRNEVSESTTVNTKKAKLVASPNEDSMQNLVTTANVPLISEITNPKASKAAAKKIKRKVRAMRHQAEKLERLKKKGVVIVDAPKNTNAVSTFSSPTKEDTIENIAPANATGGRNVRKRANAQIKQESFQDVQSPSADALANENLQEYFAEKMEDAAPAESPRCTETPEKGKLSKRSSPASSPEQEQKQDSAEEMSVQPDVKREPIDPLSSSKHAMEDIDNSVPVMKSSPSALVSAPVQGSSPRSPFKLPVGDRTDPLQSDASPVLKRKVELVTLWTPSEKKSPSGSGTPGPRRSARTAKKADVQQTVSVRKAAKKSRYYDEVAAIDFDQTEDPVKSMHVTPVAKKSTAPKVSPMVQFEEFVTTPPAFFKVAVKKVAPQKTPAAAKKTPAKKEVTKSTKKVNFSLLNNSSQGIKHYTMSLRSRPGIPFDADKLPAQGVLKASPR